MRKQIERGAVWVADREPLAVLLLAPWLLFPSLSRSLTCLALVSLVLLWITRVLAGRPISRATPVNLPLLGILAATGWSLCVAPDQVIAVSGATSILLGTGLFFAMVNSDRRWCRPDYVGPALAVAGTALALAGVVMGQWEGGKIAVLDPVLRGIPRSGVMVSADIRGDLGPDYVVGSLVALFPVVLAVAALGIERGRQPLMGRWGTVAWLSIPALSAMFLAVAIAQSRSGIVVIFATIALIGSVRWRGVRVVVIGIGITLLLLILFGLTSGALGDWIDRLDVLGQPASARPLHWDQRLDAWRAGLLIMRDYPFLGTGLKAFKVSAELNYGFTVGPEAAPSDARNLWLQTGAESGLLALAALLALSSVLVLMGMAIMRRPRTQSRTVVIGIWFGLLAWLMYGSVNLLPISSRLAVVLWPMLAVLVTYWLGGPDDLVQAPQAATRLLRRLTLAGSIAAVVVIGIVNSRLWSMNRAANTLDRGLVLGEPAVLRSAESWLSQAEGLAGTVRREAILAYHLGYRDRAISLFRQDRSAERFLVYASRRHLVDGEVSEGLQLAQLSTEVFPDSGWLSCLLGEAYAASGSPTEALESYRLVPGKADSFGDDTIALATCLHRLGIAERELGGWSQAAEWFRIASDLDPSQSDYLVDYGTALNRATGEVSEAGLALEQALAISPDPAGIFLQLAQLYLRAERPAKALDWAQQATEADPDEPQAWLALGQAHWGLQEEGKAQSAIAEAILLDPTNELALQLQSEYAGD